MLESERIALAKAWGEVVRTSRERAERMGKIRERVLYRPVKNNRQRRG